MNTTFFSLNEMTLKEKNSFDVSKKERSAEAISKKEVTNDFAKTLEKVSSEAPSPHKKDRLNEKQHTSSQQTLETIHQAVRELSHQPEKQTEENIIEVIEALLFFLTHGTKELPSNMKDEVGSLLFSLRELIAAWEKDQLSSQELLNQLLTWLDQLSPSFGTVMKINELVYTSTQGEKGKNSFLPQKETPYPEKNFSLPSSQPSSQSVLQTEQEKPLFRVVDKRSFLSWEGEKVILESSHLKDTLSSKVDELLQQLEVKNGIGMFSVKPIQDFGIKASPALPSLPRVSVEQMLQQVVGKALLTLRDGHSEMRLQLTPPDLGRMEMKIILEDGLMMGKIVVSTPEAKALFDQNLGELQRQLQQVGVHVGSLDVSLGQPGGDRAPEPLNDFFSGLTQGNTEGTATQEEVMSSFWVDSRVNYIV